MRTKPLTPKQQDREQRKIIKILRDIGFQYHESGKYWWIVANICTGVRLCVKPEGKFHIVKNIEPTWLGGSISIGSMWCDASHFFYICFRELYSAGHIDGVIKERNTTKEYLAAVVSHTFQK